MKKYDVVSIGAITVDMQLKAHDADLDAHGLKKGFSNMVDAKTAAAIAGELECSRNPGGPGTNVAAGVALRGGTVALTGKIANDNNGKFITQRMKDHGVDFTPLLPDDPETGTTVILALTTPDKERSFAFAPGASMEMKPEDIDATLIAQGKITYIDSYLWQTEDGRAAVKHAAETAKRSGGLVALALNDAELVKTHQAEFHALAMSHADILVGDQREFMALFKAATLEETLDRISESGKTASMTMGRKGAFIAGGGSVTLVPAKTIDQSLVIDTNGAGDQFAAGFIYGLAQGKDALESGRQGAEWASDVIRHSGAEPQIGRNAPKNIQNHPKGPKRAA
jgi:sugar/nucleoside kinase (ribokinase family)